MYRNPIKGDLMMKKLLITFISIFSLYSNANCIDSVNKNIQPLNESISDLRKYYSDVEPKMKCESVVSVVDKLICKNETLKKMFSYSSMSSVWMVENATHRGVKHIRINSYKSKCKDEECWCKEFIQDAEGPGSSPYWKRDKDGVPTGGYINDLIIR